MLKAELGNMVDKEMIATSTAIEEAVLRMDVRLQTSALDTHSPCDDTLSCFCLNLSQEILNQARRDTTGVKLEVNQR